MCCMVRQARLDVTGVLYYAMARGFEPRSVFIKWEIGRGSHVKVVPVMLYELDVPHYVPDSLWYWDISLILAKIFHSCYTYIT